MEQWNTFETKVLDDTQYDRGLTRSLKPEVDTIAADRLQNCYGRYDIQGTYTSQLKEDAQFQRSSLFCNIYLCREGYYRRIHYSQCTQRGKLFALRNPPSCREMADHFTGIRSVFNQWWCLHAISFKARTPETAEVKMRYSKEHCWWFARWQDKTMLLQPYRCI